MNKEDIILKNEGLIYYIIKKYDKYVDYDDLYQVCAVGLIKAYNNFNDSYNIKFTSYAYQYMLGEVKKYIRENKGFKVNKEMIKLSSQVLRAKELLGQKLMRTPTITDIALFLEIDENKLMEIMNANEFVKSLDYNYEEDDFNLYHVLKTEESGYDAEILDLKNELDNLDDNDKAIIDSRYYQDLTQSETSRITGLSQVQVSRKEQKILSKLKKRLI